MAYVLNGKKLRVGKAFVDPATSIQYPANWLRLASEADKAAIGVVWEVDPAPVDGRFYWSEGNPKRLNDENATDENGDAVLDADGNQVVYQGLKTVWVKKQKEIAGTLLAPIVTGTSRASLRPAKQCRPLCLTIGPQCATSVALVKVRSTPAQLPRSWWHC